MFHAENLKPNSTLYFPPKNDQRQLSFYKDKTQNIYTLD